MVYLAGNFFSNVSPELTKMVSNDGHILCSDILEQPAMSAYTCRIGFGCLLLFSRSPVSQYPPYLSLHSPETPGAQCLFRFLFLSSLVVITIKYSRV